MPIPRQPTAAQKEYFGRVLDAYSTYDPEGAPHFQKAWTEIEEGIAEPFLLRPKISYRWLVDALLEESLEQYEVPKEVLEEFHKVFPKSDEQA